MLSQNNSSSVISSVGDSKALKKLIDSAKMGDRDAFSELYKLFYTPLYRYTLSRCQDRELAEDICQQVFLKFYESLDSYTLEKSPLAYLFTIAKHLLINHKEKKTFSPFDKILEDTLPDDSSTIIDEAHVKLLAESINGYLPHLTEEEQELIRLYFYAELSYKEIAPIMDKQEDHLRKIKERALKKLRVLTQHLHEEH